MSLIDNGEDRAQFSAQTHNVAGNSVRPRQDPTIQFVFILVFYSVIKVTATLTAARGNLSLITQAFSKARFHL